MLWQQRIDKKRDSEIWRAMKAIGSGCTTRGEYIDRLLAGRPEDRYDPRAETVKLMTLHAAKGLEFPVVFMVGCEEHLLPLDLSGNQSDIPEERRLFYVGASRARERLYLTSASRRVLRGRTYRSRQSRFVQDIQERLKDHDRTVSGGRRSARVESPQLSLFTEQ
jgi:superfamily I DNA/RNA helicase